MTESTSVETVSIANLKADNTAMLQRLPDGVTCEEIHEAIDLRREIELGLKDRRG